MASRRCAGHCPASCRAPTATFKSSKLAVARTNMASSSLQSMTARDDPDELFDRAHCCGESETLPKPSGSIAFLMKSDPTDASAPFNLGNMLRAACSHCRSRSGFAGATRANPTFGEAWYNLADLLDDQGRSEAAIECLRKAVQSYLTTSTQCSISRCYCNEKTNMPRLQIIGADISPTIPNPNGLGGLAVH